MRGAQPTLARWKDPSMKLRISAYFFSQFNEHGWQLVERAPHPPPTPASTRRLLRLTHAHTSHFMYPLTCLRQHRCLGRVQGRGFASDSGQLAGRVPDSEAPSFTGSPFHPFLDVSSHTGSPQAGPAAPPTWHGTITRLLVRALAYWQCCPSESVSHGLWCWATPSFKKWQLPARCHC